MVGYEGVKFLSSRIDERNDGGQNLVPEVSGSMIHYAKVCTPDYIVKHIYCCDVVQDDSQVCDGDVKVGNFLDSIEGRRNYFSFKRVGQ